MSKNYLTMKDVYESYSNKQAIISLFIKQHMLKYLMDKAPSLFNTMGYHSNHA